MSTSNWQPVHTIPKNGDWVFVIEKYSEVPIIVSWYNGGWIEHSGNMVIIGDAYAVSDVDEDEFIGWMVIPKPPETPEL